MASYSFLSAVKDYAFVGESVVKLSKKKPLSFWNIQSGAILLTEHAKNERILRRKLASGFIKMFSADFVKRFNPSFGQSQLMDLLANDVSLGDLSTVPKLMWNQFLLSNFVDDKTGTGFDYVNQTSSNATANGNINLTFDDQNGFYITCLSGNGKVQKVPDLTPVKLHLATVQFSSEDLGDEPVITYATINGVVNSGQQGGVGTDVNLPFETFGYNTYIMARIEVLEVVNGVSKAKEKGKYDTLQVLGYRR